MANLTLRSVKGSPLTNAELDGNFEYFTGSHAITGSLIVTGGITGSLLGTATTSITSSYVLNGTLTGTTQISGSILISGSLIPNVSGSVTSSFSLGSATNAWKDLWVSNGTINFLNSAGQIQSSLGAGTSGTSISGSLTISGSTISTGGFTGSLLGTSTTASYIIGNKVAGAVSNSDDADRLYVTSDSTNQNYLIPFTDGANSYGNFSTDSGNNILYNPSTNTLTLSGSLFVSGSTIKFTGLPTSEPATSGQLWLSGSAGSNSKILCVRN